MNPIAAISQLPHDQLLFHLLSLPTEQTADMVSFHSKYFGMFH